MKITHHDGSVRHVKLSLAASHGYNAKSIELDEDDVNYYTTLSKRDPDAAMRLLLQLRGRVHRYRPGTMGDEVSGTRPTMIILDEVSEITPETLRQAADSAQKAIQGDLVPPDPETPAGEADRGQTERVHFRLITMPCCGHLFCNVNPRLPSYCPMCGSSVYPEVKSCITISDEGAILKWRME